MTISSLHLLRYLNQISYPVDIYAEKDDRVLISASESTLMLLINKGSVTGVGSFRTLKRIRFSGALSGLAEKVAKQCSGDRGESLKLTYREPMENKPYCLKRLTASGEVLETVERWEAEAHFTDGRFNPDRIPEPLTASTETGLMQATRTMLPMLTASKCYGQKRLRGM